MESTSAPSMVPSPPKLDNEDIFDLFYRDNTAMKALKQARDYLASPIEGLFLLKLTYCNGDQPMPFSDAACCVTKSVSGDNTLFYYQSVFRPGFRILDDYINNKPGIVPEDSAKRLVLKRLLTFLLHLKDADKALNITKEISDTEWTMRLTHHLLSPLAADENYSIDQHSKSPDKGREKCPCCEEQLRGKFTDTSIGNPLVWHGFLDVILGSKQNQEVPVHVAGANVDIQDVHDDESDDEPDSAIGNISSFEVKLSSMHYRFYCQMISETIVFSFLQKQFLKEDSNTLIPCIGVTRDEVYIFMYDHKHDILLESSELMLRKKGNTYPYPPLELSVPTVVALWLAINYKYLCSGTSDSMRKTEFTADFPKLVPSVYQVYEKEVKHYCGKGKEDETYTGFRTFEHAALSWCF